MLRWKNVPMVYYLIPLAMGILARDQWWAYLSLATLPCAAMVRRSSDVVLHWLLFFPLGLGLASLDDEMCETCRYIDASEKRRSFLVRSAQPGTHRSVFTALSIEDQCNVSITVKHQDSLKIGPGDTLAFSSTLHRPSPPANPFEFDYGKYLKSLGILWTTSTEMRDFTVNPDPNITLTRAAFSANQTLKSRLSGLVESPLALHLCQAIVLGDKNAVSREQKEVFTSTGTMHIMAVSGLHVGMVAGLLLLLIPSSNGRFKAAIRLMAFMSGVWAFVLITGAKSSAVRAGTMFSLFYLSRFINRDGHPVNSLFTAALLIVIWDPGQLYQVGTQFSFTAVLSILVFQPMVAPLWLPSRRWVNYIWQVLSVTISVQILLAPVSLYYFHVFPVTFLFSNLIAIPMAAGTLVLSFLTLLAGSWQPAVGRSLAHILEGFVELCFGGLKALSKCSAWNIQDVWIHPLQVALILISILMLTRGITLGRSSSFRIGLLAMLGVAVSISVLRTACLSTTRLMIYGSPYLGVVDMIKGHSGVSFSLPDDDISTAWRSIHGFPEKPKKLSPDTNWLIGASGRRIMILAEGLSLTDETSDVVICGSAASLNTYLCHTAVWPDTILYTGRKEEEMLRDLRILAVHQGKHWQDINASGSIEIQLN